MPLPFSSCSSLPCRLALVASLAVLGTFVVGCPGPTAGIEHAAVPNGVAAPQPSAIQSAIPSTDPTANAFLVTGANPTIATAGELVIKRSDLDSVLYEAFGTKMLFHLVELDMAKQMLEKQGMKLTQADIDAEREKILVKICGQDTDRASWDNLFNQFLQQKNLTRTEFEINIIQTRACLRKIVEPKVVGHLPEAMVHNAFDQMFGAERQIRDIRVQDLAEAAIARNKLVSEPFEQVAKEMSNDPRTAPNGGLWQPFSINNKSIPDVIAKAAFGLGVGAYSEPLQVGVYVHIIKVVEVIPPKIAKYADERELVRKTIEQQVVDEKVSEMQTNLQKYAEALVKIDDPIIGKQWEALKAGLRPSTRDRSEVLDEMTRHRPTTAPTTGPTGGPVMGPIMGPTTEPVAAP